MKDKAFSTLPDIKTFKKKYRMVPLADFSQKPPPEESKFEPTLAYSTLQPQAMMTPEDPTNQAIKEESKNSGKVVIDVNLDHLKKSDGD